MNAYQVQALKRRGINIAKLGCVMQEFEPVDISDVMPDEVCFYSKNPERRWIRGRRADEPHVTLLYGLLDNANTIREDIDEVLEGWEPAPARGMEFEVFESPYEDEKYGCIVARVDNDNLLDAHHRLSLLPHIDTFPGYKAHVTLGYVK